MRLNAIVLSSVVLVFAHLAAPRPANATIVFSEDFDDITLSTNPLPLTTSTVGNSFTEAVEVTDTNRSAIEVEDDDSNWFGAGTSNQYLQLTDGNDGTAALAGPTTTISGTGFFLSLDFYDPSDTYTTTPTSQSVTAGGRLTLGGNVQSNGLTSSSSRSVDLWLDNGAISYSAPSDGEVGADDGADYTEDAKHTLSLVGNYSGSTINYFFGGSQSVAPGRYDIFVDGVLLEDDAQFRNTVTSSSYIGLQGTGSSSKSETYFDNIVIKDAVPIPEPSAALLLLGAIGCFLARQRTHHE